MRIHCSRTLALILCLCLLTPVGSAASSERTEPARESGRQAASTAEAPAPEAPQTLSAEEAEELSVRAEEPGTDVVGGALTNTHLTYIVIALAAAVIVLIAK
jgi:hypothetical protein